METLDILLVVLAVALGTFYFMRRRTRVRRASRH